MVILNRLRLEPSIASTSKLKLFLKVYSVISLISSFETRTLVNLCKAICFLKKNPNTTHKSHVKWSHLKVFRFNLAYVNCHILEESVNIRYGMEISSDSSLWICDMKQCWAYYWMIGLCKIKSYYEVNLIQQMIFIHNCRIHELRVNPMLQVSFKSNVSSNATYR